LLKTPERQVQYTYDPTNGTLIHIDTGNGQSQSFVYDGSLLLEERWEGVVTGKVSRAYGDSFRVQSLTVNGQYNIPFEYDADSLITRAGELRLARDPQNGLLNSATNGSLVETWSRNGFGETTNHTVVFSGSTLATFTYGYDLGGRITNQIETVRGVTTARTFAYDPLGRVTHVMSNGVAVASYTFDANGNRLLCSRPGENLAGTYDAQDRLLSYGAATYAYDATGELTNIAVGAQSTLQQYDALGNLTRVVLPNATVIEYVYDGTQRRVGRRANGALTEGFLFSDSAHPIAELDGTNQVVALFIYMEVIRWSCG
jgi:YD repeat-containing protein